MPPMSSLISNQQPAVKQANRLAQPTLGRTAPLASVPPPFGAPTPAMTAMQQLALFLSQTK